MGRLASPSISITHQHPIVAAMRLALAASALLIVILDPPQPERLTTATYATLGIYTLYSAAIYALTWRLKAAQSVERWGHWVDIGWYTGLIALSGGTSSIFFFGFFFAILAAAFRQGFAEGLRVTLAAVLLFSSVGIATAPQGASFELNRTLVRPMYLLVLGYLMAYWGGQELGLRRRLQLLRDVSALRNPRFGVDRTIGALLEHLRTFYDADACLMIVRDPGTDAYQLREARRGDPESVGQPTALPDRLAGQLLALPAAQALLAQRRRGWRRNPRLELSALGTGGGDPLLPEPRELDALLATLETARLLSTPLHRHELFDGRLFVLGSARAHDRADLELLQQVVDQVTPVIENIRLVDRLASDAADQERQRIARDLHDSVIQPYIGLQLALGAVQRKHRTNAEVAPDLQRLRELTSDGLAELRAYVQQLKAGGERGDSLTGAIERFAAKFGAATGIDIAVHTTGPIQCNDRLGAEVFQMVAEGLSNIRRHTAATRAAVDLRRTDDRLILRVANEATVPPADFTPRSISERAMALGGSAAVEQSHERGTAIVVTIPL